MNSSENNKPMSLTCNGEISWGGSKPTKLNTSNLQKHLMIHKDEYKHFVKDEKKGDEISKKRLMV